MSTAHSEFLPAVSTLTLPHMASVNAATVITADAVDPHPMRRLPCASASEFVLTNAAFFHHIVSFQDGLPGLLRELKRDTRAGDGFEPDLPTAAAKHHKLRAFEMIHELRQLPQYANRRDLKYRNAANKACEVGDAAILRWIINCPSVEHRLSREEIEALWNLAVVYYKQGNFRVFELLGEHFTPAEVTALDKNIWGSIRSLELLKWVCERYEVTLHTDMFVRAINRSDAEFVDFWISNRPHQVPKNTLVNVLRRGDAKLFARIFFNKDRVHDSEERKEMILIAVRDDDVALVRLLHEDQAQYPFENVPTEALELAAERGHLEIVQELYSHHEGIVTGRALELAAVNGHTRVLEFLSERCGVKRVPGAMDAAATNGYLDVVRYLHEVRGEECTAQALVGALTNNHDQVAVWLLENRNEVRSTAALNSLLLRGKTSEWLHYRDQWSLVGNETVDGVACLGGFMFEAGRTGDLTMIRFIVKTLGREELLPRAYEGAVEIGSLGWLLAIYALDSKEKKKRVPFCVIEQAVAVEERAYRFETLQAERCDLLKWLIMHCEDKDESCATSEALELLRIQSESNPHRGHYHRYYSYNVDLGSDLAQWTETRESTETELDLLHRQYTTGLFGFIYRGEAFDWVVERAVQTLAPRFESWGQRYLALEIEDKDPWGLGVWTLPKRAVARNDLDALKAFRELSESLDATGSAVFLVDDDLLRAAIATGNLAIAQWFVSVYRGGKLDDADLLDWAVKYGHSDIAEWLQNEFLQCCTSFSAGRFDVLPGHMNARLIDWFNRLNNDHPALHTCFEPLLIACITAHEAKLELLKSLINHHVLLPSKTAKLINEAAQGGHFQTVEYLFSVMKRHFSPNEEHFTLEKDGAREIESAVKAAADEGNLELVQFLCSRFPDLDYSTALPNAATLGHVRVVYYLLKHQLPASGDTEEIRQSVHSTVRRLGYLCHTHGASIL